MTRLNLVGNTVSKNDGYIVGDKFLDVGDLENPIKFNLNLTFISGLGGRLRPGLRVGRANKAIISVGLSRNRIRVLDK